MIKRMIADTIRQLMMHTTLKHEDLRKKQIYVKICKVICDFFLKFRLVVAMVIMLKFVSGSFKMQF